MYAEYFAVFVKQSGVPRLNYEQFGKMMNVVFLEGEISAVHRLRSGSEDPELIAACNRSVNRLQRRLETLTGSIKPADLMRQFVRQSILGGDSAFEVSGPWED